MEEIWKCDKCGHEGGNKGDYSIIHENCGGQFCLTTQTEPVADVLCNVGLSAIADLIERAQDDTCRAQRRLSMFREGAARVEALNAKQCLILAIDKFNELGI